MNVDDDLLALIQTEIKLLFSDSPYTSISLKYLGSTESSMSVFPLLTADQDVSRDSPIVLWNLNNRTTFRTLGYSSDFEFAGHLFGAPDAVVAGGVCLLMASGRTVRLR